jgi:phosphoserine phosphatase RsbU/P
VCSSDLVYEETSIALEPGDVIFFYTDGVTESADEAGVEFGMDRLLDLVRSVRHLPAAQIVKSVSDAAHAFQSPGSTQDDLTLSVVKYV